MKIGFQTSSSVMLLSALSTRCGTFGRPSGRRSPVQAAVSWIMSSRLLKIIVSRSFAGKCGGRSAASACCRQAKPAFTCCRATLHDPPDQPQCGSHSIGAGQVSDRSKSVIPRCRGRRWLFSWDSELLAGAALVLAGFSSGWGVGGRISDGGAIVVLSRRGCALRSVRLAARPVA